MTPTNRMLNKFTLMDQLGRDIVTGAFSDESSFKVEADLCKTYGVSRSVLREAVKMLSAKGMLASRPKQGTWVQPEAEWNLLDPDVLRWLLSRKELSLDLLVEFTEIRMAIEPIAARLAIRRATQEDFARMHSALDAMQEAADGIGDPLQSDIDLHISVLIASQNRFLVRHQALVETALSFSIRLTNEVKQVPIASIEDHAAIVYAIEEKREADAIDATMSLLNDALAFIEKCRTKKIANA